MTERRGSGKSGLRYFLSSKILMSRLSSTQNRAAAACRQDGLMQILLYGIAVAPSSSLAWTTPFAARQLLCFWNFSSYYEPHRKATKKMHPLIDIVAVTPAKQHMPWAVGCRHDGERIHMSRRSVPLATSTGMNLSDDLGEDDARWARTVPKSSAKR
ncbi:hypothetical protein B0H13DRAFT_1875518 [Mycena leptocephala]|nr:hypothetical protein B0H13DRAFT_1875518 [Mycena leptocephala]